MQKYLHDHFLREDHDGLLNNVYIIFIDNTDPSNPERREEFWRTKLRTLAPLGLNVEESFIVIPYVYFFTFRHFNKVARIYYVKRSGI